MSDMNDQIEQYIEATVAANEARMAYKKKLDEWAERAKPELDALEAEFRKHYERAAELGVAAGVESLDIDAKCEIARETAKRAGFSEEDQECIAQEIRRREEFAQQLRDAGAFFQPQAESPVLN